MELCALHSFFRVVSSFRDGDGWGSPGGRHTRPVGRSLIVRPTLPGRVYSARLAGTDDRPGGSPRSGSWRTVIDVSGEFWCMRTSRHRESQYTECDGTVKASGLFRE